MKVEAYKSADGTLYETELSMAKANVEYWKNQVERLSRPIPQPIKHDPDRSYGDHQ